MATCSRPSQELIFMNDSWKLDIFKTWDEVDAPSFIEQWRVLIDSSTHSHVFFHPSVLKAWTDSCRSVHEMSPLYCRAEKDGITFFLPLVLWKRNWKKAFVRMLVPAGYPDYDYHDPVTSAPVSPETLDSFWGLIRNSLMNAPDIKFDEALLCGMHVPAARTGWKEYEEACPYSDLSRYSDFSSFFGSLRKNLRKDIERQKKRLSEAGRLSFRVFERHECEQALAALPEFLEVHSMRWPHAFKPQGFHEGLIRAALPEGLLHFSEIRLDDKAISWHFGFRFNSRFYYYMPAFLEEYGMYSPGKIHLYFLLEDAYRCGVDIFDFLRGTEDYKKDWASEETALYSYPFQAAGAASSMKILAREALMVVKRKLFIVSLPCFSSEISEDLFVQAATFFVPV